MLKKLFIYEWKAMGRILFPLFGVALIMSVVGGITFKCYVDLPSAWTVKLILGIAGVLFGVIIFASLAASPVMSVYRFRKNLFDCEGYLMNTLPVTPMQNILAKLFPAIIYELISGVVAVISGFIFLAIVSDFQLIYQDIPNIFSSMIRAINNQRLSANFIILGIEFVLMCITGFASLNLQVYASIAIGHSANDHKILKSVGVYILSFIVIDIFSSAVISPVLNALWLSSALPIAEAHAFFWITIAASLIYSAAYLFLINKFMKDRLNLS